jgi:hypothetical protein
MPRRFPPGDLGWHRAPGESPASTRGARPFERQAEAHCRHKGSPAAWWPGRESARHVEKNLMHHGEEPIHGPPAKIPSTMQKRHVSRLSPRPEPNSNRGAGRTRRSGPPSASLLQNGKQVLATPLSGGFSRPKGRTKKVPTFDIRGLVSSIGLWGVVSGGLTRAREFCFCF